VKCSIVSLFSCVIVCKKESRDLEKKEKNRVCVCVGVCVYGVVTYLYERVLFVNV